MTATSGAIPRTWSISITIVGDSRRHARHVPRPDARVEVGAHPLGQGAVEIAPHVRVLDVRIHAGKGDAIALRAQ